MPKLKSFSIYFVVLVVTLWSCGNSSRIEFPAEDTQNVSVDFVRYDTALFQRSEESLESLSKWYYQEKENGNKQLQRYVEDIMRVSAFGNPMGVNLLHRFASDSSWIDLQKEIDKMYGSTSAIEEDFIKAFRRYHHIFPKDSVPGIFFYNSGFATAIFPDTNMLGIGLEWFLGSKNKIVQSLPPEQFPMYKREKMEPELLIPTAIRGQLLVHKYTEGIDENVLSLMLYYGKVQLALEAILPEVDASKRFLYKPEQLKWCEKNETKIWKVMVKEDVLFNTSDREKIRWTNDGPFTSGLPDGAPPRLGIYIGYQIVKAYFEKNSDLTFEQLFAESDYRKILQAYKPF